MIVNSRAFRRSGLPTIAGSLAKRRCQSAFDMIATGSPLGDALLSPERPAEHERSAEDLEVVVGDDLDRDALEVVVRTDCRGPRGEARDAGEDVGTLLLEIVHVGERGRAVRGSAVVAREHADEPVRLDSPRQVAGGGRR